MDPGLPSPDAAGALAALDPAVLRRCRRVSTWRTPLVAALLWAVALLALGAAWTLGPLAWAPAVLLVVGVQHGLLTVVHEGAHGLVHPDRRWNDLLTDVLAAAPCFATVGDYRAYHLLHHRAAGGPGDPERGFWRSQVGGRRGSGWRVLAADVCGVNLARTLAWARRAERRAARRGRAPRAAGARGRAVAWWAVVGGLALALGAWPALLGLWVLPQALVLFPLTKLRMRGEHTGVYGASELERTWTHELGPAARALCFPLRSGHHLEHHLAPTVPWYRLAALRRALLALPGWRARAEAATVRGWLRDPRSPLRRVLGLDAPLAAPRP